MHCRLGGVDDLSGIDAVLVGAISFGPRESLGLFEGLLAVSLFRPETTTGNVFPIEEFARAAEGIELVAAALRGDPVLDDPDALGHAFGLGRSLTGSPL